MTGLKESAMAKGIKDKTKVKTLEQGRESAGAFGVDHKNWQVSYLQRPKQTKEENEQSYQDSDSILIRESQMCDHGLRCHNLHHHNEMNYFFNASHQSCNGGEICHTPGHRRDDHRAEGAGKIRLLNPLPMCSNDVMSWIHNTRRVGSLLDDT